MRSVFRSNRLVILLTANAVLLLLILLAITTRARIFPDSPAYGQSEAHRIEPIAVSAPSIGLAVMPCQLSQYVWGCYMLDPQNQTLCVYKYEPNAELRLLAARDIEFDRKLGMFNTSPLPSEVRDMLDKTDQPQRVAPTTMRSPEERYR